MIPATGIRRLASAVLALAMVVMTVQAVLNYQTVAPGNITIVTPGSVTLIQVYKDAALTQPLTLVSYPQTEPFNGQLPSVESVWVKNAYSSPVSMTVTMTGLPSGTSFAPVSGTITVGASAALGTLNITMTTGAVIGPPVSFTVVFTASA